jgi:uncharacterized protein YrrD
MQIRASVALGMPVVDEEAQEIVAFLSSPLILPDTGKIEGFFVISAGGLISGELFLSCSDIVAWGTRVHVLSFDRLSPPEELIRLQPLLDDPRPFLGQRIMTKRGKKVIGICDDVQFDTRHFLVQWIFPKKFFFFHNDPLPTTEILEVTPEAIIIREPLRPVRQKIDEAEKSKGDGLPALADVLPQAQTRI